MTYPVIAFCIGVALTSFEYIALWFHVVGTEIANLGIELIETEIRYASYKNKNDPGNIQDQLLFRLTNEKNKLRKSEMKEQYSKKVIAVGVVTIVISTIFIVLK